jgi:hypothetical protein
MDKATIRNGALLALLHLVATLGLLIFAFSSAMAQFDTGLPAGTMEEAASLVVEVLIQPIGVLWSFKRRLGIPQFLEWPLFLLNSVLWGYGVLFIARAGRRWRGAGTGHAEG